MRLSDLTATDELLAEQLVDPGFRAEWERTAIARAVALRLVRYRTEHGISQRELAKLLEMKQPQVARLERGDVHPGLETLMRLSGALDIEFTIDVRPSNRKARLVTRRAEDEALISYEVAGVAVLIAAG
jgi:transcriptional regulator with XRE-family HTH domain